MTAALLERTPDTRTKPLPGLRLLVLARIACEEGATRGELIREIGPYAGDENATRLAVERELAQLIRDSKAIELKARFTASPDGVVLLLGELALKALPATWTEMLEVRVVAKALGIEREASTRLKFLGKPDVLRAEILIHGYGLDLRGTASATRVRAALALIALERAFGNKIKGELTSGSGFNAKAARVLAGQLLKRPRDAGTDKRLVTLLAAEQVGAMKLDTETVRTALIRKWAGVPPEPPQLTGLMRQSEPIAPAVVVPARSVAAPATRLVPVAPPVVAARPAETARPPAAARPDLPGFVRVVQQAAAQHSEGWPGNRKALVSRVYNAIAAMHPGWGLSLVEFKAMLAECHRIGQLVLATADLKDKGMLDELRLSAVSYKNTVWHLVRVEE